MEFGMWSLGVMEYWSNGMLEFGMWSCLPADIWRVEEWVWNDGGLEWLRGGVLVFGELNFFMELRFYNY